VQLPEALMPLHPEPHQPLEIRMRLPADPGQGVDQQAQRFGQGLTVGQSGEVRDICHCLACSAGALSWLDLTGPRAPRGDTGAPALVFDKLTAKDAQGQCTKCHSVDDIRGRGRKVNWGPASIATKYGRFTNFVHEPHFGVLENRGCLTCHSLAKGGQYLKSYEGGNPRNFVSNFSPVKKDLCQTCHTQSLARQDCLLCHKYHVGGVITPIMTTKIPQQ
jgi:hypothetical protein